MGKRYKVTFIREITVEMDEDLLPDDELRQNHYRTMTTQKQLAAHIATNAAVMGWDHVEGLTPEQNLKYAIVEDDYPQWGWDEVDVEELPATDESETKP